MTWKVTAALEILRMNGGTGTRTRTIFRGAANEEKVSFGREPHYFEELPPEIAADPLLVATEVAAPDAAKPALPTVVASSTPSDPEVAPDAELEVESTSTPVAPAAKPAAVKTAAAKTTPAKRLAKPPVAKKK